MPFSFGKHETFNGKNFKGWQKRSGMRYEMKVEKHLKQKYQTVASTSKKRRGHDGTYTPNEGSRKRKYGKDFKHVFFPE